MYCEQRIAPPAASAENAWITNTLMESTRDTADIAAEPTLLTIMVSTVPIREFSTCSKITGINRVRSILFVKICCCSFIFFHLNLFSFFDYTLNFL